MVKVAVSDAPPIVAVTTYVPAAVPTGIVRFLGVISPSLPVVNKGGDTIVTAVPVKVLRVIVPPV
jgi:hypothetical protein